MKKTLLIIFAVLSALITANAQDASSIRIYLNPGHGSWGPDDRPLPTIPYPATIETGRPDTCGFYESNTNLWKTLAIGDRLIANGFKKSNIVHSRTQNGPYPYVAGAADAEKYNRNLTEICEEVEAGNFDMFLSVHSNAAGEGAIANYSLLLYRGYDDGSGSAPGSVEMCENIWPHIMSNGIDYFTAYQTSMNIRGDIDFYHAQYTTWLSNGKSYTGYLGVLKHGVPGLLSEGYYHTYQPARHRALNKDYCGQEGVRYTRGILDYFDLPKEKVGYIMGTVKDSKNRISHSLFNYATDSNDQWFPINGATVKLLKDGEPISEYKVDDNYNGVFVFSDLEPSEYILECTAPNYNPLADTYKKVTVTANTTTYPKIFLTPETGYTPSIPGMTAESEERTYYAYSLRHSVSNEVHTFAFRSTGEAKSASVILTNTENNQEMTFPLESVIEGMNTLKIEESKIPYGTYNWAVQIESEPRSEAKIAFRLSSTNSGSGVAVNTDPNSNYFGQVYFSDSYATKGIHMLNADLSKARTSALFSSEFAGGQYYSPGRLAINPNNSYVYIADWLDAHGGIYYFNPALTTRLNTFLMGTRESSGRIVAGTTAIGSSTSGLCFQGTGADTKLYAFEEDYPTENANRLCRYDIGTSSTWNKAPSETYNSVSNLMLNTNVSLVANDKGVWLSQIRGVGNNTASVPAFVFMKNSGIVAYNSGSKLPTLNGCNGGALAVNTDNTLLAVTNGNSNIEIYNVIWSASNTPTLRLSQTITNGNGAIAQMAFDYAGNLLVSARNGNFLIALPNEKPVVTTPAAGSFTIEIPNSIETIGNDKQKIRANVDNGVLTIECPAQDVQSIDIYSSDGIRLRTIKPKNGKAVAANLQKGIYIVKAGTHTIKVLLE